METFVYLLAVAVFWGIAYLAISNAKNKGKE